MLEKERIYINNLIEELTNDENIGDLNRDEIDELKVFTFRKNIIEEIGYEQYTFNLRKILKYQVITNSNDEIMLKTIANILSTYSDFKANYGIDCFIIKFILFGHLYGYDVINDDFFSDENKDRPMNKDYRTLQFLIYKYSCGNDDNEDKDFITFMKEVFRKIGKDSLNNLFKLFKGKKNLNFSILYVLYKNGLELSANQQQMLFNPRVLGYYYHPINNIENLNEIKKRITLLKKKYTKVSKTSETFNNFMFDSFYFQIISRKKIKKTDLLNFLKNFNKKYRDLGALIRNPNIKNKFSNIPVEELNLMETQHLYLDILQSRLKVEYLLETLPINDLRDLFDYLNRVEDMGRFKYGKISNEDSICYQWYVIFELSRLFLHSTIKKEHFDWLHLIYNYTKKEGNGRVALFYNLTLGKFSFSFIRIGTQYFTQGYNLLLKQLFKNFWLRSEGEGLKEFENIGKELSNEFIWYGDSEEDIIKDIFKNESIDHEFKASLLLDRRTKLQTGETKEMNSFSIIKPIVAFLNGNVPGRIIVGIREGDKVCEEVEEKKFFTYPDLTKYGITKNKKTNFHYLTGIDLEKIELFNNKTNDNLIQQIDNEISKNIEPNPTIGGGTIKLYIKNFLGKSILIVDVIPGNTVFGMKVKKDKNEFDYKIYVRKNGADKQLNDSLEIVEFTKNKISNNNING